MHWMRSAFAACAVLTLGCTTPRAALDTGELRRQVEDAERAFARTMADRDHAAFTAFVADEAVFFAGDRPLRGKEQIASAWKQFYDGATAPFSWEPTVVEVLESGTLALSSGPVRDASGRRTGTFNSIWRLEAPGRWRVIFDKGCPAAPAPSP